MGREGEREGEISTHTASQQQIAGRASEQRGYSRTQPKPALSLDTEAGDIPLDTNNTGWEHTLCVEERLCT